MSARDRIAITVVGLVAVLAAAWFVLLAPVREEAAVLAPQVSAAQARLATAQGAVAAGEAAEGSYAADYAAVARLGKAVPEDDGVASLVVQLQAAADRAKVDFRSIDLASVGGGAAAPTQSGAAAAPQGDGATGATGASGATGPSAAAAAVTQAATAALPPGTVVGAAGFPTMPFTFAFNGTYFRLQDFLQRLNRFTRVDGSRITVSGRLLSVDGFALVASPKGFPNVTAAISATAYLLPEQQGLTGGAPTPGAPATALPPPLPPGPVPSGPGAPSPNAGETR